MKTRTLSPMGALHPILFFAGVYVVVLLFSIFICSVLFYSCNSTSSGIGEEITIPTEIPSGTTTAAATVVVR
jgi:predicted small secreted protein